MGTICVSSTQSVNVLAVLFVCVRSVRYCILLLICELRAKKGRTTGHLGLLQTFFEDEGASVGWGSEGSYDFRALALASRTLT